MPYSKFVLKYNSTAICGNVAMTLGVIVGPKVFHICETYIYTPYLVYTPNSNTTYCVYLSIHSYMYISIYICSPVKQKNTGIFPKKKQKTEKFRRKTKTGQSSDKSQKINPVTNILKSKAYI